MIFFFIKLSSTRLKNFSFMRSLPIISITYYVDGSKSATRSVDAYLINTRLFFFVLSVILTINEVEMDAALQCILNLLITRSTNFLLCSNSKVSLRKLQTKHDSKTDTMTTQTLHLLHFFQPHI